MRYQIAGVGSADPREVQLTDAEVADMAASFQEAVVDCLVAKAEHALAKTGSSACAWAAAWPPTDDCASGWRQSAAEHEYELLMAPLRLCTDNAVMGAIALEKLAAGCADELDLDVQPGLVR